MALTPTPQQPFTVELTFSADGTPTLLCRGRMNLETAAIFRSEVKKLSTSHHTVFADLSGVDAVDSSGLGSVLGTYVSAQGDGCNLVLVNVHPHVKDLLNITHLTSVFDIS